MSRLRSRIALAALALLVLTPPTTRADEGMWVYNNLPLKLLAEKYGFTPTPAWIEHIQKSSVRMNNGGSASFVSPDGLIITNHHVGSDALAKLSTPERDLLKTGFHARTRDQELKAPDLEINVLVGIENVTDRVNAAVKPDTDDATAGKLRREAMATIEKESLDRTGLRSDIVTLYQGGQYHLYTYKRYTDVRLVFAPEFDIAFFGGDPDNFEYPRYDLDITFFRAYENGQPAQVEHFLKWSPQGASKNELVFVSGHPGRTSRLNTLASLEYQRDFAVPHGLDLLHAREAFLIAFAKQGEEQARQAQDELFSVQNSRKAYIGRFGGLKDPDFMARKAADEKSLRDRIAADPDRQKRYGAAWERIAAASAVNREISVPLNMFERGMAFDSELFRIARTLVRYADEKDKPNAERLREFGDAGLESLKLALFSEAPIYPGFEQARLDHSLAYALNQLPDNDLLAKVLDGHTPEDAARQLVEGSKLADVAVRKQLFEGGKPAIDACDDSMIALARLVDPVARALRKRHEDQVQGVEAAQYALIARALFDEKGDSTYPDATFTLRLSYGTIQGYEQNGQHIPPFTTIGGAFDHERVHHFQPPYRLPESWRQARESGKLKLDTPFNFVSTADIIGGNSGSPTINAGGEFVGIIFDGNIQSLVLDYGFDDKQARAVSVDSRGIVEALRAIYGASELLGELGLDR